MTFKEYWQKNRRGLLLAIGIVGTVLFAIGGWELLVELDFVGEEYELPVISGLDEYSWGVVGIGAALMIFGYLYYHDINKKHKRFEELMDTESKASFVRNLEEIEELAVELGPEYVGRVVETRKRMKVKTK